MAHVQIITEIIRVLNLEGQAILDYAERLKTKEFSEPFEKAFTFFRSALDVGGKIVVTGVGKSGKIGQKIAATLSSTGSPAVFIHASEAIHGDIGLISHLDAVLMLSYTGNTQEVIQLLPPLRNLGVPIIGIGGNASSKLAAECNVWIHALVNTEACPHNLAPTTSTTLALAIGDALAVALMQVRGFDSKAFHLNHPGGSLGKRLQFKVKDLMHGESQVSVLSAEAPIEEVIIGLTEKKLGAVLIAEGRKLVGIVTEGDLRRALQVKEKFFHMTAKEVMTEDPVVVTTDMLARTALERMENRPSQISVLPVVDGDGNWQGLLRLHDIVREF